MLFKPTDLPYNHALNTIDVRNLKENVDLERKTMCTNFTSSEQIKPFIYLFINIITNLEGAHVISIVLR